LFRSALRTPSGPVLSHVYPPRPKLDGPICIASILRDPHPLHSSVPAHYRSLHLIFEWLEQPIVPDRASDCHGSGGGVRGASRVAVVAGRAARAERGDVPLLRQPGRRLGGAAQLTAIARGLPERFLQLTRDRGMVVKVWAPQFMLCFPAETNAEFQVACPITNHICCSV
jgi:hypothetical protein